MKRNAIAGRRFASWAALEAHLEAWTRDIADVRVHGTTGEAPRDRFRRDEARALKPLNGTAPFTTHRDLVHSVGADCAVAIDDNTYSVPWRLIGGSGSGSRSATRLCAFMAVGRRPSMPS